MIFMNKLDLVFYWPMLIYNKFNAIDRSQNYLLYKTTLSLRFKLQSLQQSYILRFMNKGYIVALLLSISLVVFYYSANEIQKHQFQQWKNRFGSPFDPSEQVYRELIFYNNHKKIKMHNSQQNQTFKMAINQFSIYTQQQFKIRYLMDIQPANLQINEVSIQKNTHTNKNNPNGAIDWTTQGKVSHIKNQGQCGSCWAFSTTGALQSYALFYNRVVDLSQQQLVDCSSRYGNNGCSGGYPYQAFKYVYQNGLKFENQYPYAGKNQQCRENGGSFRITNVYNFVGCNPLANAIFTQPLSVTVDASNWAHYQSGIFNNCAASINHCVLLVGIDQSGNWKIKNSWGTSWGEGGYIRLSPGNTCGLCNYAGIYPR